ncbi:COesterase domain-containing protein [Aphelenchoides bicaudatus]|nr:COesterase domain-containing protein [Aphelenchoides bicaudatus]
MDGLEGKEVTTNNNMTLHLFKRIPFAQPPLGQLRFQKPQPVNTWTGTLNATEYGDACLGIRSNSDRPITMSEDCLNINVFTSHFCLSNGGCPVFVMIHGGVFAFGNSIQYNDTQILEKFVKHDIIFVLPAMRVGFFGFADFGDDYEFAPYNVGLYDIIANLEWIQHNIQSFGGNSSRVTLMGYSAGATAIQFLMSSPQLQSHQLFSQAMLSSGQPVLYQHRSQRLTTKFVEISNCSQGPIRNQTFTVQEKLDCLRNKSADQLNELTKTLANSMQHNGPQSNQHLFSAENYFEMASKRTPIKLLVMTALNEMDIAYDASSSVRHVCAEFLQVLNYYQKETIDKCVERYNTTLELSNDFYHAIAAPECHLNNQKLAAPCYPGILVKLITVTTQMICFIWLDNIWGKLKQFTINDMLMDDFYPQVVRNFVNGQQPSESKP